jgi:hypothetical protein
LDVTDSIDAAAAEAESAPPGESVRGDSAPIATEPHLHLFCRVFIETHDPYKPSAIDWPRLAPEALARLAALPIWDIAVATEGNAALRMECFAARADDPFVSAAVALNAFEERRHKDVLGRMLRFYGIAVAAEGEYRVPPDPLWAFLRTGYGELLDSFFAFGLFALARRSADFPPELVEVFEPVIQEEARHNLFFVNWLDWERRHRGRLGRVVFALRCAAALSVQVWSRLRLVRDVDGSNFTRKGGEAIGIGLEACEFLALCLAEHDHRMSVYDARLLRPRLMPTFARVALRLFGRGQADTGDRCQRCV